jgi:hypothetical protein
MMSKSVGNFYHVPMLTKQPVSDTGPGFPGPSIKPKQKHFYGKTD